MLKHIYKLPFNTFLLIVIGISVLTFLLQTVTNYFWRNPLLTLEQITVTSGIVYAVGMALILYWYNRIKKGSKNAFTFFKWLSILAMVSIPVQLIQNYWVVQSANNKLINMNTIFNPGSVLISIINFGSLLFSFAYLTNYWKTYFEKKSK